MRLDDPALPAARYLVGADALDVLRVPIEATGGRLESAHVVHVRYRPGSDVVVRYSAGVSWNGAEPARETFVVASAVHGTYPDVVPLSAATPYGQVEVGVWRWPYDPVLRGLATAVTRRSVARLLDEPVEQLALKIVAYRPTDRAVVRVSRGGDDLAYLKVVAPDRVDAIARRHRALRDGGVPAPPVRLTDSEQGIVVLEVLNGPTFRELIKGSVDGDWPDPTEVDEMCAALRGCDVAGRGPNSRLADGVLHGQMLATVLPELDRLDRLVDLFATSDRPEPDGVVHGDLHEGQLIVSDGSITGLLDVDDVGPGASVDDVANLLAHLHYRDVADKAGDRDRLVEYRHALDRTATLRHGPDLVAVHTAAALVGLATGPFRIQSDGWPTLVGDLVERAERISMREVS